MKYVSTTMLDVATNIIKKQGGIIRSANAIALGVHPRTLYALRDSGIVEQLSRGIYRLTSLPPLDKPDLVITSLRAPKSIFCLVSALSFHEMGTQITHQVDIAYPQGSKLPKIDYPPLRVFWYTAQPFIAGIEKHQVDGITIRVYSPAKTVADCFKFRNRIGIDVAIEALQSYWQDKKGNADELSKYAKICRIETVIKPYMEAIMHG